MCVSGKGVGWDAERGGFSCIMNMNMCWPDGVQGAPLYH